MGVHDLNTCMIITSNFKISVFGYNKWKNLMMLNIKFNGRLLIRSVGRLLSKILKYDYVFRIFTHKRVFKLRKRGNLPC